MLGAVCGDILGSYYEVYNLKSKKFKLFGYGSRFTDDTVMTCAIAKASMIYNKDKDTENFKNNCIKYMKELGLKYLNAGYGGTFIKWLLSLSTKPYNSWGNGSAMRVSSVAYVADSLEEAELLGEISASVTHNHPNGIAGAKAVAGAIWLLIHGYSKNDIKEYINNNYYSLNFTLDEIRDTYKFDVSCSGSIPQSIVAFLEGFNYEDTIRNAISIGGDSDTIAAIAGSLAEPFFGIPEEIKNKAYGYLTPELQNIINNFYEILKNKDYKIKK